MSKLRRTLGSFAAFVFVNFIAACIAGAAPAEATAGDTNWPQWRGPLASGVAPTADPPTTWGEGKNVRWKVKVPGRGTATPIIWGDSIFIQTAMPSGKTATAPASAPVAQPAAETQPPSDPPPPGDRPRGGGRGGRGGFGGRGGGGFGVVKPTEPYQFVLLCLDRKTGDTRWKKVAREEVPHEGHHPSHGFSSFSPVTDGERVYAYFGSRGLHCYDMDGNLKWEKSLGRMETRNSFGEGSSPALYGDILVVIWDHQGDDFIVAFDKKTGDEKWRTPRDEEQTWSTPLIVEVDGKPQVITVAAGKTRAYDLATGTEVWQAPGLTANTIPTPVAGDGLVFATAGFRGSALYAIRPAGRSGDLSDTDAIAWTGKRGTPYVPSPLLYGDRLYLYQENRAVLSVFDVKTGKALVETQRIDDLDGVYASPVGAGGRVYLVGRNGATAVIKHMDKSDKLEVLATNQLDEKIDASPAIAGKELFLRGAENLYCIAE